MNSKLISIDVAKNVFQVCTFGRGNKVLSNKKVRRAKLVETVLGLPRAPLVMEACYSANYWGRRFQALGFEVKLIPAQHVKPFVRGNKNDANDAVAIGEAALRPAIRFVPVKTLAQQDLQILHRVRQRRIRQRTALVNQMRGLLSEYGVIAAKGWRALKTSMPSLLEDGENELSDVARACLHRLYLELGDLNQRVDEVDEQLFALAGQNEDFKRLRQVPGFGPVIATALVSAVGNAAQFSNARQMAVWLGLTPRQSASGESCTMHGISKRGDRYLRTLLVHGARTVVNWCAKKDDPLSVWVQRLIERRGKHKATVALAHKLARFAWVILNRKENYRPPGQTRALPDQP